MDNNDKNKKVLNNLSAVTMCYYIVAADYNFDGAFEPEGELFDGWAYGYMVNGDL